jgi:hypothetical protein
VIWDMNMKVWFELCFDEVLCVLSNEYESIDWSMFWLTFKVWWKWDVIYMSCDEKMTYWNVYDLW